MQHTFAIQPNTGDLRDLVLPGGGSLALKMWAGMRVKAFTVRKLLNQGAQFSPHCKKALAELEEFADGENSFAEHALKIANAREALMIRCEIYFLVDAFQHARPT